MSSIGRWGRVGIASLLASVGCTSVLGVDGEYDDALTSGASGLGAQGGGGSGALGGIAGSGNATSGGASGSAGASGSGSGSGGIFTAGEDCSNGVDDDGDGDVDCMDTDCSLAGYRCVTLPPVGFDGPVVVGSGANLGPCTGAYPVEELVGGDSVVVDPTLCGSCSCGALVGGICDLNDVTLEYFGDGSCSPPVRWTKKPTSSCFTSTFAHCVSGCAYPSSARAIFGAPKGGMSCQANKGPDTFPTPKWKTNIRACSALWGKGCGASQCLPPASGEFSRTCIYAKGAVPSCPAPYSERTLMQTGFDDKRACGVCSCKVSSASCTGTITDHLASDCSGSGTAVGSSCTPVTVSGGVSYDTRSIGVSGLDVAGSCTPSGGTPSGGVAATDTITLCCLP
ncbi:MAG: hypothetical protein R3B13_19105 [Polyangiaceae bacterium]